MNDKLIKQPESTDIGECKLKVTNIHETGEMEIQLPMTDGQPEVKVRFPKDTSERYKLLPEEFADVQNAIETVQAEQRQIEVHADSIESRVGYNSLIRLLGKYYGNMVAYYRSEHGGALPLEEARARAYRQNISEEQATELLNNLLRMSKQDIHYGDLLELHEYSPATAENLWEMIKREAQREFESGHRAAEALEPVGPLRDAWNRASYLGLRESLCEEWQPQGGIELSMIDAIAQAWLQLQFWTKESVKRGQFKPRQENYDFQQWKRWRNENKAKQWVDGDWDVPNVTEQQAVEHAAQMADRFQRMYFRAIRSLRDWRRYTPQVTINNPNQVNIAADGGQQFNVSGAEKAETK
jgi:predicted Zn-dependent protease with MMP-like domain